MNPTSTLSKSDFKLASDCPQKLLYKKAKYPNSNDENEFLQILAEGGYIVGKMAQVMYEQFAKENGYVCKEITSDRNSKQAIQETEELLIPVKETFFSREGIGIRTSYEYKVGLALNYNHKQKSKSTNNTALIISLIDKLAEKRQNTNTHHNFGDDDGNVQR